MAKRDSDALRITRLALKNWRNFKSIEIPLRQRAVVVGPNAVGKSNMLDSVRFLADLAGPSGGLSSAVATRGGLGRVRFLNTRNHNHGWVHVEVDLGNDDDPRQWTYAIDFTGQRRSARPVVKSEQVFRRGESLLHRPGEEDDGDPERLTQTALEQVAWNREFRPINQFLAGVRYLHLVPQLIRDPGRAQLVIGDPFGTDFLEQIATSPQRELNRRLAAIGDALRIAVPQLESMDLKRDASGRPHLEARYRHWRERNARQDERDFSDGTLRLTGLLWSLLDTTRGEGVILLEEPELSLHGGIASKLPAMFARAQSSGGGQVVMTTHSADVLDDEGLGLDEVVLLLPGQEGSSAELLSEDEESVDLVQAGALTLADIVRARSTPESVGDLTTAI